MSGEKPVRVLGGGLTGRYYAITRYDTAGGGVIAKAKHDVTADVHEAMAKAWWEGFNACNEAEPGTDTPNPYHRPGDVRGTDHTKETGDE